MSDTGTYPDCTEKDNSKWTQEEIDAARAKARELRLLFGWEHENETA